MRPSTLDAGPPDLHIPGDSVERIVPAGWSACYQSATLSLSKAPSGQSCTQPHIRPTYQRLPTLDAWNATVQRQLDRTLRSKSRTSETREQTCLPETAIPTTSINPQSGGHCANAALLDGAQVSGPTIAAARRPLYNKFTYPGFTDPDHWSNAAALMCCSTDQGNYLGNDASSIYNALQIKVDRRFSHGSAVPVALHICPRQQLQQRLLCE